jgi:hypothetical protein
VSVGTANNRLDSWTVDKLIALSVIGIAEACIDDSDERLNRLLATAIDDCTTETVEETVQPARARMARSFMA